jgi:hypothetical protein
LGKIRNLRTNMKKQFQNSWHEIKFQDFIEVSEQKVADSFFYDKFYEEFFKKYGSFSDIPIEYITKKIVVVNYLKSKMTTKNSVLSIGCGIGLIENLLLEDESLKAKMTAVEPSKIAIKWISDVPNIDVHNGLFPDVFKKNRPSFDFAYARAIEYIFSQEEYIKLLKSILDYGIKEFAIISVCIHRRSLTDAIKETIKIFLSKLQLYDRGQLWGYLRTEGEHRDAFIKAGYKNIFIEKLDYSTIVITGKV